MMLPLRTTLLAFATAAALGCGSTEPTHRNVGLAREAWIATNARDYSFELTARVSILPATEFRVTVTDRTNVTMADANGEPTSWPPLSIDRIWEHILAALEAGELHSASFDSRGVPVESNMGDWARDGGASYSVRAFVKTR